MVVICIPPWEKIVSSEQVRIHSLSLGTSGNAPFYVETPRRKTSLDSPSHVHEAAAAGVGSGGGSRYMMAAASVAAEKAAASAARRHKRTGSSSSYNMVTGKQTQVKNNKRLQFYFIL